MPGSQPARRALARAVLLAALGCSSEETPPADAGVVVDAGPPATGEDGFLQQVLLRTALGVFDLLAAEP